MPGRRLLTLIEWSGRRGVDLIDHNFRTPILCNLWEFASVPGRFDNEGSRKKRSDEFQTQEKVFRPIKGDSPNTLALPSNSEIKHCIVPVVD